MLRSLDAISGVALGAVFGAAFALVSAAGTMTPARATEHAADRTLPMRFDLRRQGPVELCGAQCQFWISASGAITADSARDFTQFIQERGLTERDLARATVVLDSDGGSVLGAIALGRAIRKVALATTVGRTVDLTGTVANGEAPRAVLSPRADCESMCAFVLLGGVERSVPDQARVMVHQIWLGDRREDPTAANYSAEDLVLVQRDIGRLARFTAEMGASIDLLDLALRIPPWEPLHVMTRNEIRRTGLATGAAREPAPATVAASRSGNPELPVAAPAAAPATLPALPATLPATRPATFGVQTAGAQATAIGELRWAMVDRAGVTSLARRHPLTVEGDDIGSFDMAVSCGAGPDSFDLSYIERRHAGEQFAGDRIARPEKLDSVSLRIGRTQATLKVVSSQRQGNGGELLSYASGPVPAAMIRAFTGPGDHSMIVETTSKDKDGPMLTVIRMGNTGARRNLPKLAASCAKPIGDRAEAALPNSGNKSGGKTGGMAAR